MTQVYNPQWQRCMDVDAPLMRRMRADAFLPQHTGGGCFAWEHITDDGGWIWITEESGSGLGEWSDRNSAVWLVGRYSKDGEDWLTIGLVSLVEALRVADTMRAPRAGETASFNTLQDAN